MKRISILTSRAARMAARVTGSSGLLYMPSISPLVSAASATTNTIFSRSQSGGVGSQDGALPEFAGIAFAKPDGRIQVRFQSPKFSSLPGNSNVYAPRLEGHILLTVTPTGSSSSSGSSDDAARSSSSSSSSSNYDFNNQLSIRLGVLEILQVVQNSMMQPATVNQKEWREPQQAPKVRLDITPPPPPPQPQPLATAATTPPPASNKAGLYKVSVTDEAKGAVSVHLTQAEVYLIRNLLGVSLPWVTGWQYNLDPTKFDPHTHVYSPRARVGGGPSSPSSSSSSMGSRTSAPTMTSGGGQSGGSAEDGEGSQQQPQQQQSNYYNRSAGGSGGSSYYSGARSSYNNSGGSSSGSGYSRGGYSSGGGSGGGYTSKYPPRSSNTPPPPGAAPSGGAPPAPASGARPAYNRGGYGTSNTNGGGSQ